MAKPRTVITWTTLSTQPPRTAAHTPSRTEMTAITHGRAEDERQRHREPRA